MEILIAIFYYAFVIFIPILAMVFARDCHAKRKTLKQAREHDIKVKKNELESAEKNLENLHAIAARLNRLKQTT